MPAKQYVRDDRRIRVSVDEGRLTIEETATATRPPLSWSGPLRTDLRELVGATFLGPDAVVDRLVAEIPSSLAGQDWEEILQPAAAGLTVVRHADTPDPPTTSSRCCCRCGFCT
jgi:hypothetical protein